MNSSIRETPGTRAMRRDSCFPDVVSEDVMSLLEGDVSNLQQWAELLLKHAISNRSRLDLTVHRNLVDLAQRVLQEVEDVRCITDTCTHLASQGGFDGPVCSDCFGEDR